MDKQSRLPTISPMYEYPHALVRIEIVIRHEDDISRHEEDVIRQLQTLERMDKLVPGARAMVISGGRGWPQRLRKLLDRATKADGDDARDLLHRSDNQYVLDVPAHGYLLAHEWLDRIGVPVAHDYWRKPWPTSAYWGEIIDRWPILDDLLASSQWGRSEDTRTAAEEAGLWLAGMLIDNGELKARIQMKHWPEPRSTLEVLRPHQCFGLTWAASRPNPWFQWPPGRGKTLGGLSAGLVYAGDIMMLGPAKSRKAWHDQIPLFSQVEPHMFLPASLRGKAEDLPSYLERMAETGQRAFVACGTESLPDYWNEIEDSGFRPTILIWDEAHENGDSKRFSAIPEADGSYGFEAKLTKGGDRVKRSVAVTAASRLPSVVCRVGLTGTSLDDGKPRRLWAPLDLVDPWGLGSKWDFASAFCGLTSKAGHPDDSGRSRMDELKQRTDSVIFEATYEETSRGMPPVTIEVTWLPVEDQDDVSGYTQEMSVLTARQEIPADEWDGMVDELEAGRAAKNVPKALTKLLDDDFESRSPIGMLQELRIAEACSRKRSYVVNRAVDEMTAGGKVMIFTTRRRQTELWAARVEQAVRRRMKGDMATRWSVPPLLLWAHGGTAEGDRWRILDDYVGYDGPACFTTTAQASGTSLDGMQCATRMIIATMPSKLGLFQQVRGRADRYEGVGTIVEVVLGRKTYDEDRTRKLGAKIEAVQELLRADDLDGLALQLLGLPDIADAADRVNEMLMRSIGL